MEKQKTITANVYESDDTVRLKISDSMRASRKHQSSLRDTQYATGLTLEGIYIGRKWFVEHVNSRWQSRSGGCVGDVYTAYSIEHDQSAILRICNRVGIEPPIAIERTAQSA